MKKLLLLAVLLPAFAIVSASSGEPSNNKEKKQFKKQKLARAIPAYVPEEGYWVIKSSLGQPDKSIIYYYNNDNQLVGEENISGKDARKYSPNPDSTPHQIWKEDTISVILQTMLQESQCQPKSHL